MKLIYKILLHLSLYLFILCGVWSVLFYFAVVEEINDETDDYLENFSEQIITRFLAGQELSTVSNGSNNSFFITEITERDAKQRSAFQYFDEMIYIVEKSETEPARILKTIFKDNKENYYELTVSIPTIEKNDLKKSILGWIIFLYILLLIIIIVVNTLVFHQNMKPLYKLLDWVKGYTIGKKVAFPQSKTKITEFRKLYEAMETGTKRNEEIFEQQKQFISNASHELQTPLAICKNRLEMLADNENLQEKELEEILKTQETLEHIIKLNKTLLFLSKIENGQFPEIHKVNFNELIEDLLPDFQEAYRYKNILLTIENNGIFKKDCNETLARALMTNLIKNAFIHNYENGKIYITIDPHAITIRNTGKDEALDKGLIFTRFNQKKSKKENSTGLGLFIAYTICKYYRLNIRYKYLLHEHHFIIN